MKSRRGIGKSLLTTSRQQQAERPIDEADQRENSADREQRGSQRQLAERLEHHIGIDVAILLVIREMIGVRQRENSRIDVSVILCVIVNAQPLDMGMQPGDTREGHGQAKREDEDQAGHWRAMMAQALDAKPVAVTLRAGGGAHSDIIGVRMR